MRHAPRLSLGCVQDWRQKKVEARGVGDASFPFCPHPNLRRRGEGESAAHFHFQRILEWAFFQGLDLCPPPRRRSTRWRVDSFWML